MSLRLTLVALFGLLLGSCTAINYDAAEEGEFRGSLLVMWIGEGGERGDGAFVFVPNPRDPLTFIRAEKGPYQVIQPEMMYTDGGAIPKAAQWFNGFSPWGYAPAYMVHDWLFIAARCNLDGIATDEEAKFIGMEFQDSAVIMAEAIKTLIASGRVGPNDVAPSVISSTVAGPVSRELWTRKGACETGRVREEDRLAAEAGLPRGLLPTQSRRSAPPALDDGLEQPVIVAPPAGQVVGVFSF